MDLTDILPSVALTVLFLLAVPQGQKAWLKIDTYLTLIFAFVSIFAPGAFLQNQVKGELDKVHKHMYRMFGITLLSTSLFAFLTRKSNDSIVKSTTLWARVIALSVYILNRTYSYFNIQSGNQWNEKALYFGIYGDCLWFLGNLFYALKSTHRGENVKVTYTRLDRHLLMDFMETFLFALTFYVFPGHMLGFQVKSSLDRMHACIIRIMASFIFGSTVIAGSAVRFTNNDDKLAHLLTRLLCNAIYISAQLYAQLTTESWTNWHIYFGMMGMSFWSVNAAIGYKYGALQVKQAAD